jgi:hypothetical protein
MQTRQDFEFMGRMLELPRSVLRIADAPLRYIVSRNMAMPEPNALAQRNIAELLAELPTSPKNSN